MALLMILSLWFVSVCLGLSIEGIAYWRGKMTLKNETNQFPIDQVSQTLNKSS